jgi:hypothetical protein
LTDFELVLFHKTLHHFRDVGLGPLGNRGSASWRRLPQRRGEVGDCSGQYFTINGPPFLDERRLLVGRWNA